MLKFKSIVLALVTLLLQSVVWLFLERSFNSAGNPATWILFASLASLSLAVTTLFFLSNWIRFLTAGVILSSLISYLAILGVNIFVVVGGLLFAGLEFWYEARLFKRAQAHADFSISHIVSSSVNIIVYGLLLLLSLNIYYHVANSFEQNPDEFYNRLGQQAAKSVPYFSKAFPNNLNLNQPFGEYLESQAIKNSEYKSANVFEQKVILSQARTAFTQQFQITAADNESLADIMAELAVSKVRQATAGYEAYLPLIFTIIIVGLLYTFIFLLRWLVVFLSWILFQILFFFGFFHYEKVMVEVKKLVM